MNDIRENTAYFAYRIGSKASLTARCGRRTKPTNGPGKSPASNILPLPFIQAEISSVCTIIVSHRLLRIKK